MADTDALRRELAWRLHDRLCTCTGNPGVHTRRDTWHFDEADALLPVIEQRIVSRVDEARAIAFREAATEIRLRAAEMATKSRDFGRGYSAAAVVVDSLTPGGASMPTGNRLEEDARTTGPTLAGDAAAAPQPLGGSPPPASPRPCVCGHPAAAHDLTRDGSRTSCSVHLGPRGTPCGCREYQPGGGDG